MAFSFEPFLAISAGHFMAVSAGPEHHCFQRQFPRAICKIQEVILARAKMAGSRLRNNCSLLPANINWGNAQIS